MTCNTCTAGAPDSIKKGCRVSDDVFVSLRYLELEITSKCRVRTSVRYSRSPYHHGETAASTDGSVAVIAAEHLSLDPRLSTFLLRRLTFLPPPSVRTIACLPCPGRSQISLSGCDLAFLTAVKTVSPLVCVLWLTNSLRTEACYLHENCVRNFRPVGRGNVRAVGLIPPKRVFVFILDNVSQS